VSEPVRTCVGCGAREPWRALVRLRSDGGRVVIDRERKGGRGAWLHPSAVCLEAALRRRSLGRALRQDVRIDPPTLRGELTGSARKD
jgi:predicted RNA-binding protein YlxR (DUF448 family)